MKKKLKKELTKRLWFIAQTFALMGPKAQHYIFTAAVLGTGTVVVLIAESSSRFVIFRIRKIHLFKRRRQAP